jgi:ribosomal protein S18 acetylase RimI-like enzyme
MESDKDWIQKVLSDSWGSSTIITRGFIHYAEKLSGFVAVIDGENVGLLTFSENENMLEIITLNVLRLREGIGRALVQAAVDEANNLGCSRVWVITTNDNVSALEFYQGVGFKVVAVHKGAVDESRKLKPEIPLIGIDGIPITDEIELEMTLST